MQDFKKLSKAYTSSRILHLFTPFKKKITTKLYSELWNKKFTEAFRALTLSLIIAESLEKFMAMYIKTLHHLANSSIRENPQLEQ